MPNLVGIGNSQVPTNAMLGGLAFQDPAHANLTNAEIENIAALKATIYGTSSTVYDVFVYDTRKDSDGGAWRKRCQHTSWYNEPAGAYRGHRKEFPAVAILVLEAQQLFIYDGDDPNCSMWMRFVCRTNSWNSDATFLSVATSSSNRARSCEALNAKLVVAGHYGVAIVDFINESQTNRGRPSINASHPLVHKKSGSIALRNDTAGQQIIQSEPNNKATLTDINSDISMIVRPGAPIDETTGLPIPTIAAANNVGVSIIQDNGYIIDKGTSGAIAYQVEWMGPNRLVFSAPQYYGILNDPLTHEASSYISAISNSNYIHSTITTHDWMNYPALPFEIASGDAELVSLDSETIASAHATGCAIRQLSVGISTGGSDDNSGMTVGITTNYNTGWMLGDVKGAWLADTKTGDLSAANQLTELGSAMDTTFSTPNGWTANADWTISGGVATCDGQNNGRWLYPNTNTFAIGTSVVVEVTVTARTSGTLYISYGTGGLTPGTSMNSTGTYKFAGVCTGNQLVYLRSDSFVGSVDNVKMYKADPDRNFSSNNGLIPYGAIGREPVATGADLVGYKGFNSDIYLKFDATDMAFGTGDFAFICWAKPVDNSEQDFMLEMNDASGSDRFYVLVAGASGARKLFTTFDTSVVGYDLPNGVWSQVVVGRTDKMGLVYVNGVRVSDGYDEFTTNFTTTGYGAIGNYSQSPSAAYAWGGSLALARISGTMPTEQQVKKMYNDEKVLFEENAKCTLYGSSSNVEAIAYDDSTNILHAGTSSGRSDLSGLRRINNTTDEIASSMSASNGLVVEI